MIFLLSFTFLLFFAYAVLFLYYRYGWSLIVEKKVGEKNRHVTPVSVVIPFRNEAHNLPKLLECLSAQHYPSSLFEIILVDDHSEDGGASLIQQINHPNIRCVFLEEHLTSTPTTAYKKRAIEAGIRMSKGELIITTDADCTMGPHWISSIVDHYEKTNAAFMVMPVLLKPDQTVCGLFQSIDFMTMQGITAASNALRFHHMCNGANLAYTRSAFDEVDGFKGIDHIASGDDLLLMNKIAERHPSKIVYLKNKDVIVSTSPASGWKAFLQQRIRWASKAGHYQDKKMLPILLLVYMFNLMLFLLICLLVFSLFSNNLDNHKRLLLIFVPSVFFLKTVLELVLLYPVSHFFSKRKLLFAFPLLQPFHVSYVVIAGWLGKFGTYVWKGRTLR